MECETLVEAKAMIECVECHYNSVCKLPGCSSEHPHGFTCRNCRDRNAAYGQMNDAVLCGILNKFENSNLICSVDIRTSTNDSYYEMYGVRVIGNKILVPKHFVTKYLETKAKDPVTTMIVKYIHGEADNIKTVDKFTCSAIHDVALLEISVSNQSIDTTKYMPKTMYIPNHKVLVRMQPNGKPGGYNLAEGVTNNTGPIKVQGNPEVDVVGVLMSSHAGMCGLPYFLKDKTSGSMRFVGIHIAGSASKSVGATISVPQLICKETIDKLLKQLAGETPIKILDLMENSAYEGKYAGSVCVSGRFANSISRNSRLVTTEGFYVDNELPYELTTGTPDFSNEALDKGIQSGMGPDVYEYPSLLRQKVIEEMVQYYNNFESTYSGTRPILSIDEGINGVVEGDGRMPFFSRMDPSTSLGFLLRDESVGKTRYIKYDGLNCEVDPFIYEIVNDRLAKARKNMASPVVWIDSMKDERRPIEKVKEKKTRIFSTGMFDHNICVRMYFGAFLIHVSENHMDKNVSVGINLDNKRNSTTFYTLLERFGSHWIAGDYSAYDKTLPYAACMAAIEVINKWYNDSDEDKRVRRVLAAGLFSGFRLAGSNLYRADHGMPSGTPLTAVGNSVINSFLMRCVFALANHIHGTGDLLLYDQHVIERYYGDDNLLRVTAKAGQFFNLATISMYMKVSFGMTYTNADKSEITEYFTPEERVTYLKRRFERRGPDVFAVMPLEGLRQMVLWSKHDVTDHEFHGVLRCFCYFMSRWKKEVYDEEINYLKTKLPKKFNLMDYDEACSIIDAMD
jgi:hypothetical protein